MPDAVMLVTYPAVKPLNAKGYVTRFYTTTDLVLLFVPMMTPTATEQLSVRWSVSAANAVSPSDLGRVDVVAPAPTTVTAETAYTAVRSAISGGGGIAQDLGRVDVTAPVPTAVTTEAASAEVRGV